MVGLIVGLLRFGLEFGFTKPPCGDFESPQPPDWWFKAVDKIHYLHFGLILWAISGIVTIGETATPTKPSKKDLPGWRIGLNWLCGVEMDDGDGVDVEIPQVTKL